MTDPRTILWQARQGSLPEGWRVFTKKRGKLSGFLRGSSQDPDPLLVITPDGAVEYVNERKPLTVVNFNEPAGITLQVHGEQLLRLLRGQHAGGSVLHRGVRRPQGTSRTPG